MRTGILQIASRIETHVVKTLHPLESIGKRISQAGGSRVIFARTSGASSSTNGESISTMRPGSGETSDPVIAATMAALDEPLGFPPLAAGIVPGDRVAIVVDESLPSLAAVVRGAVEAFAIAGIDREAISIVTSQPKAGAICREEFDRDETNVPQVVVHDPEDKDNLCMTGRTKRGDPLLINRTIFDADVVLPIGCARAKRRGAYECLFPRFSDIAALQRHRKPASYDSPRERQAQERETDEAGWLVGVPMIVEVVPGSGDTVEQVIAGEPQATADKGKTLSRQRWGFQSCEPASLVVATVTGGATAQRWDNIGRALAATEPLLEEGGAVAICSNLDEPPGESLGHLFGSSDLEATQRKLSHEHGADSAAAWQIARALQRGPVYFLSQLPGETVEDMGLAPVADIEELVRLAGRHERCLVIDDAQYAIAVVDDESDGR